MNKTPHPISLLLTSSAMAAAAGTFLGTGVLDAVIRFACCPKVDVNARASSDGMCYWSARFCVVFTPTPRVPWCRGDAGQRDPRGLGCGSALRRGRKCRPVRRMSPEPRSLIALGMLQTEGGLLSFPSRAVPISGTRMVARVSNALCRSDNLSQSCPRLSHFIIATGARGLKHGAAVGAACIDAGGGGGICVSGACFSLLRLPRTQNASPFRRGVPCLGPTPWGEGPEGGLLPVDRCLRAPSKAGRLHAPPITSFGHCRCVLPGDQDRSGPSQAAGGKHNVCASFLTAPGSEAHGRRPSCESVWQLKIIGKQLAFGSSKNASSHIMMFH